MPDDQISSDYETLTAEEFIAEVAGGPVDMRGSRHHPADSSA
jgi:hypothetical protein